MEKIYAGSAKIVQTNYGEMTKVSFHKDDINKMVQYMKDNGSDWINLDIKAKQSPQDGKPTHYLEVNTWKPQVPTNGTSAPPQAIRQPQIPQAQAPTQGDDDGDTLPF